MLQQLEREPKTDEELMAKFTLYETYSRQVELVRERVVSLYEESRPTLPQAVASDMNKQIKKIDSAEAMGIPDDSNNWFVYHMMKQAGKNNKSMAAILKKAWRKQHSWSVPAETLGCCHRVCRDCWAHWSSV